MKWWMILGGIVLVGVAAAGVAAALSRGVVVEAASASRGEIRQFVDERAKTRLPETYLITMPYNGRIEPISLVEDDRVRKGQIVAQLVQPDLDNTLAQAQAIVDRLNAAIEENNDLTVETTFKEQALKYVESVAATVEAAKGRVGSSAARLKYAESHLARLKNTTREHATTADELDLATSEESRARFDHEVGNFTLKAIRSIEAATALLPTMIEQYIRRKGLATMVLQRELAEAQARLEQVKVERQRGSMTSPVDGVVLDRLVSNQRQLAAGTILMRIGRLEDLQVEADVLSQDVVDVKLGDEVEVYGPAVGRPVGEGVRGVVHRIYPSGFTKISSLGVEQQRVKVIICFADGVLETLRAQRDLGVDYRVRVRIFTARKNGALIVPRSALFRGADGAWEAFAVRRGRARRVGVEVGLINDRWVEITEGIVEDEQVVLAPETGLQDGSRVKPVVRSSGGGVVE